MNALHFTHTLPPCLPVLLVLFLDSGQSPVALESVLVSVVAVIVCSRPPSAMPIDEAPVREESCILVNLLPEELEEFLSVICP